MKNELEKGEVGTPVRSLCSDPDKVMNGWTKELTVGMKKRATQAGSRIW